MEEINQLTIRSLRGMVYSSLVYCIALHCSAIVVCYFAGPIWPFSAFYLEQKLIPIPDKILSVSPAASIYDAAQILVKHKVHRILMIDNDVDGDEMIVSVMTPYRILNFIAVNVSIFENIVF